MPILALLPISFNYEKPRLQYCVCVKKFFNPNFYNIARSDKIGFTMKNPKVAMY